MPAHKLTRKELKQDGFIDFTGRVLDFIQERYLQLGMALLAIVLMVFAVNYYQKGQVRSSQQASYLLFQGQGLMAQGELDAARARLQECWDRFGDTEFGQRAGLDLANVMMAAGENEEALARLQEILPELKADDPQRRDGQIFQAAALMNLQRFGEAAAIYRELLQQSPSDAERMQWTFRVADCLRGEGQIRDALNVLESLQEAVDSGELKTQRRPLDSRVDLFRALAR